MSDDPKDKTEEQLLEKIEQNTSVLPRLLSGKGKGLSVAAEVGKSIKKTLIPRFRDEPGRFASRKEDVALATAVRVGKVADKAINEIEATAKSAAKPEPIQKASIAQIKPIVVEVPGKPEPAKTTAPVTVKVTTEAPQPVKANSETRVISETVKQVEHKSEPAKAVVQVAPAKVVERVKTEEPVKSAVQVAFARAERVKAGRSETPTTAEIARDRNGRFLSAGVKAHDERKQENKNQNEKKTLLQTIKDGFKSAVGFVPEGKGSFASKSTIEDAAGKAAGGPIWEAVKELGEAVGELRNKAKDDTTTGKILRKIGARFGFGRKDTATVAVEKTEKAEQKRHRELIQTVQDSRGGGSSGNGSIAETVLETVGAKKILGKIPGGAALARIGGMAARVLGVVGSATGLATLAAIFSVGSALKSLIFGGSNPINDAFEWMKKKSGFGATEDFETGGAKNPAATISNGKGDHGGQSYGSFQLSSKQGEVDSFLKSSGYASQFAGMEVGSPAFNDKWKEIAANDPNFAPAQKQYAMQTKYKPQMAKLKKAGKDLSGRSETVQDMVLSTANQYGPETGVIERALKGKNISQMSDGQIINAVQDYKLQNVKTDFKSSSATVQDGVAQRIMDEKGSLLQRANQVARTNATTSAVARSASISAPAKTVQTATVLHKPTAQPVKLEKPVKQPEAAMPNLDRLEAAILKIGQNQPPKQEQPGIQVIKTGFDDTMLTLIAHDRI